MYLLNNVNPNPDSHKERISVHILESVLLHISNSCYWIKLYYQLFQIYGQFMLLFKCIIHLYYNAHQLVSNFQTI